MNRLISRASLVLGVLMSVGSYSEPIDKRIGIVSELPSLQNFLCGSEGKSCCRPPESLQNSTNLGQLVNCKQDLGCDISANTCVSPCGREGQVCCDGPETNAPRWTEDGKVYQSTGMARDMCQSSYCNKTTRRCVTNKCGMNIGDACCPPQPSIGVASCLNSSLYCKFETDKQDSGICQPCGEAGRPACDKDYGCREGFAENKDGICVPCGTSSGQPICDRGDPCRDDRLVPHPLTHTTCVDAGGLDQPCMKGNQCAIGGLRCNEQGICGGCGKRGENCCSGNYCQSTTVSIGCITDRCRECGEEGQPCCGTDCKYAPPNTLECKAGICKKPLTGGSSQGNPGSNNKDCYLPKAGPNGEIFMEHTYGPQCP